MSGLRFVPRKWLHRLGLWAAGLTLLVAGGFVVLVIWIALANSDWRARTRSTYTVVESRSGVEATLVLHQLLTDENAMEASIAMSVAPGPARDSITAGLLRLRFHFRETSNAYPVSALQHLSVTGQTSGQDGDLAVMSERFRIPLLGEVSEFPWDDYVSFVGFSVEREPGWTYPASLRVLKEFPGWEVSTEDHPLTLRLTLRRPLVQKVVVFLSGSLYLLTALWVVFSLRTGAGELNGLSGATAFAGFVLAAAGYREIIGLSSLPSASWLDLIILGVPLSALLASFVAYYRRTPPREQRQADSPVS